MWNKNNKIDQVNLTEDEKKCILDRIFAVTNKKCNLLNKKNSKLIDSLEIHKKYEKTFKKGDFIYIARSKFYKKIIEYIS